jgi:hypothetical protein
MPLGLDVISTDHPRAAGRRHRVDPRRVPRGGCAFPARETFARVGSCWWKQGGRHGLTRELGTATDSLDVAKAGRLQQIVGHQPRLHEWQQVPTRKHVSLDAEPVTSDPALQADREETVVIAG